MRVNPGGRPYPGTRPAQPVIVYDRPDDWLCAWSHHEPPDQRPYWELKYIHTGCLLHRKLQAI